LSSSDEAGRSYRDKSLLIDSNLLLLFFVGLHDRNRIEKFKRTAKFSGEDFDCLVGLMERSKEIVTTPRVLTEVSNLLGQLPSTLQYSFYQRFSRGLKSLQERYAASGELADEKCFPKFGLTDTAILQAARGNVVVLTDDLPLAQFLRHEKVDVINFNHLRRFDS
jgi:hypothetical protein